MNENKFLKYFSIAAFVVLVFVSCWATVESLHLLLSTWPIAIFWIVAVIFFVVASIGTKLIVDSFNHNIRVENRPFKLIGGLILVLAFWLCFSMPTNTHTFLYRSVASGIVKEDIQTTVGYLNQLANDTRTEEMINTKLVEFDNKIKAKLTELEIEIKNEANPGFGPHATEILRQFAELLDVPKVEPISNRGIGTVEQRNKLVDMYREKIYALAETKKDAIRKSMENTNKNEYQGVAKTCVLNLNAIANDMNKNSSALNNVKFADELNNRLSDGYATIKIYNNFVSFDSESDKSRYTAENPVTKVKRLMSVFDVWKDFFKGLYKGYGFGFWILVAILVDIAGFIFFDIAFARRD